MQKLNIIRLEPVQRVDEAKTVPAKKVTKTKKKADSTEDAEKDIAESDVVEAEGD